MTTNHKVAVRDYPFPLNEIIRTGISSVPIEELNMEVARSRFLPSYVMKKNDDIISIYRVGGDSRAKIRIDFVKRVGALNKPDLDAIQALKDTQISVLFFFDADDKGIEERIVQIKSELKQSFPESEAEDVEKLTNKEILAVEDINIGGFVFAERGKDIGLLEDILIPLMKRENEDIFDAAEAFLDIHESTALFKGKVKYDAKGEKKKVNEKKYTHEKSLVGTVGQLQASGKSNTVCISDTDYLTDDKIKADSTCIDIFAFIQKSLNL